MTPEQRTARALAYVTQALDRIPELEARATLPADVTGAWVSLKANLESAKRDLEQTTPPAP